MKTKILIECPQQIPSVRVGVMEPLRPLEEAGLCEIRYRDTLDMQKADIQWCDVVICVRGSEYATLRIMQAAKKVGRFLIYFLDDDLLNIPGDTQTTDYYRDQRTQDNLKKILSLCDCLWVVNQKIAELYQQWCSRWVLSRVPAVIQKEPVPLQSPIRILYAGSADHTATVQEKLTPAITRILKESPKAAEFVFIGADPGIRNMPGIVYHPFFESYDAYRAAVAEGNFHLGLAPGNHTQFYACKYYNKYIEYSSYGICGIYENAAPYTLIVRDDVNGLLAGPTAEDWYGRIQYAIQNPQQCQVMAYAATDILRDVFSPAQIAKNLQRDIPELVTYVAGEITKKEISLPPMRWVFFWERILLNFRVHGGKAVFVLVGKFFKRIKHNFLR